jgi:hypothetical protein
VLSGEDKAALSKRLGEFVDVVWCCCVYWHV